MTIKENWINIDKDKETIIHEDLQKIQTRLYAELGLDMIEDWRLIQVTERDKKYIRIQSLHRIPLKHLAFIEEEGFWFDAEMKVWNKTYPHHPTHNPPYNYVFVREDYIKRDRRFYECNYTPVTEEDNPSSSSTDLGAEINMITSEYIEYLKKEAEEHPELLERNLEIIDFLSDGGVKE